MIGKTAQESKLLPCMCVLRRLVGELEAAADMEGSTVFEIKNLQVGQKRKREPKGDPADVDGYKGPWREYEGQEKVAKPTEEQMAVLVEKFHKKKKEVKDEDETIEEISELQSELHILYLYEFMRSSSCAVYIETSSCNLIMVHQRCKSTWLVSLWGSLWLDLYKSCRQCK